MLNWWWNIFHICAPLVSQYVFVSLLSRDSVYDVLRRICTHLQVRPQTHTPASCSLARRRRRRRCLCQVKQLISSPSAGQRQESELEAVHGGADLIDGQWRHAPTRQTAPLNWPQRFVLLYRCRPSALRLMCHKPHHKSICRSGTFALNWQDTIQQLCEVTLWAGPVSQDGVFTV